MSGRTLTLAAVTLLIGCCAGVPESAQAQNLEAGKSPSQIFATSCTVCHKSPRGLLKTVPPGSLQGFLREHYTTSPDMASLLSSYLIANGAADVPRGQAGSEGRKPVRRQRLGKRAKPGAEKSSAAKPGAEELPGDGAGKPVTGAAQPAEPEGAAHGSKAAQNTAPQPRPDSAPSETAAPHP